MVVFNPIRILVVDDEESIRRLMEKELNSMRRNVCSADSARHALELIEKVSHVCPTPAPRAEMARK